MNIKDRGDWRIWDADDGVELRTYKRVTGELPEMECTKQLVKIISGFYEPQMRVLDVGCAAGHYYKSLYEFDNDVNYYGIDATEKYISFAKDYFKETKAKFYQGDIFDLPEDKGTFDIVYCCNVILHLPDFKIPLKNLLKLSKKHCIIRTLIDEKTHLSKHLYSDDFNEHNEPTNFVYQNTYSYSILSNYVNSLGDYDIKFLDDEFNDKNINKEYDSFHEIQGESTTKILNNMQIAGNKVFKWKWMLITAK